MDGELAWANHILLDGLFSFYREYVQAFSKLVKPLYQLLGQDAQPWIKASGECACKVAWCIKKIPCWFNADLLPKIRIKTNVSSKSIATLFLQSQPDKP